MKIPFLLFSTLTLPSRAGGLGLLLLLSLLSCRKPPQLTAAVPLVVNKDSVSAEKVEVSIKEVDFKYFQTKAKIYFKDGQNEESGNVMIRIRKDSLIWFNVTKLGIEGVRGLITQDSVIIWDRINKELNSYSFVGLSRKFNFQLNYSILQAAVMGNLPFPRQENEFFVKTPEGFLLHQNQGKITVDNFVQPDNSKLDKLQFSEQSPRNVLLIEYKDFQSLDKFIFAYQIFATLRYPNKPPIVINITHLKPELTDQPLKFPFNSNKFERKDRRED
jgi:Domain of unknown function (DUF4292)